MGKIVEFPGKKVPSGSSDLLVDKLESPNAAQVSKFDFTCVSCKNVTYFELGNAVFKQIEIYCCKCGSGWKVSNPVFAASKARSS